MELIKKEQAHMINIGKGCISYEYPTDNSKINLAYIEINGRYPEDGRVVNNECIEASFVIEGSGILVVDNSTYEIEKGAVIIINPGEEHYYEGNLKMCVPCTPKWRVEQHQKVL